MKIRRREKRRKEEKKRREEEEEENKTYNKHHKIPQSWPHLEESPEAGRGLIIPRPSRPFKKE